MSKQQLEAFKKFLETREQPKGITIHDGQVVIPKEVLETINITESVFKFKNLVTVVEVNRQEGTQPILKATTETLEPIEELMETPPVLKDLFEKVNYKAQTHRGKTLVSQELIDDGRNVTSDIEKLLNRLVINTENKNIFNTLNAIPETVDSSEDSLRALLTTFNNSQQVKFYVTQESYNNFDKAGLVKQSTKYGDGTILGKELVSIEGKGNVALIGNLKELIFFDRSLNTMKHTHHAPYGMAINIAARHDVKLLESNQIKKVSFTTI